MPTLKIHHLRLSWSVSRGRDTEGYTIARLDDSLGKRYKCLGGGYDMTGTVFGEFLQDVYQDKLRQVFVDNAADVVDAGYVTAGYKKLPQFYGMIQKPDGTISLDGACGIESMITIANHIGLEVQREYQRTGKNRGQTLGWFVSMEITGE